ncbi:recombination regulator RecX [Aquibacillus koreensis]|uniref:Regulatory protein RecX n=1 Tax=Aquibacillus koreensis TaxID=279446 RepID=A0A9X3WKC8_9BACI|nr:recombination regulator RecX [Aquibacillus koreensis]MCT2534385.1 recombination regulator RecX [Aquibacillus koreensis]MDC3421692.1 recombination regulator RecX [Aquibacillus koreensis]
MPKISRITTQKRNKNRYNIFLTQADGKEAYGFSVSEDILIEFHLRKDLELDEETIQLLQTKDTLHKSYTMAINFLSYRMRSKQEIVTYLKKKEVDEEQIPQVIDRLDEDGLLDDRAFAEALVRTRAQSTSKGPLLIKKELLDKGITVRTAEEALRHFPYDAQLAKAKKWVEKKMNSSSKKSFQQQRISAQQTLMQKGFSQVVIKEALTEADSAKDDNEEWEAVQVQGEKLVRKYEKKYEGYELKHKIKAALYRKGFKIDDIDRFLENLQDGI